MTQATSVRLPRSNHQTLAGLLFTFSNPFTWMLYIQYAPSLMHYLLNAGMGYALGLSGMDSCNIPLSLLLCLSFVKPSWMETDPRLCHAYSSCCFLHRLFSNQYSVAVSSRYGCYFLHPGSQGPLLPQYHACGTTTISNNAGQQDETTAKYQKAVDVRSVPHVSLPSSHCFLACQGLSVHISFHAICQVHMHGFTKRSMLLMIFLVKAFSLPFPLCLLLHSLECSRRCQSCALSSSVSASVLEIALTPQASAHQLVPGTLGDITGLTYICVGSSETRRLAL